MKKKRYILILILLSWPVNNIHRLLNNIPVTYGKYYLFSDYVESIHWYVHDVCGCLSSLMLLYGIWEYVRGTPSRNIEIVRLIGAMVIVQVIDMMHYIGWHRRNYTVLILESMVIAGAILIGILKRLKKK